MNIELHQIMDMNIAGADDYCRIRVGKLRATLSYQRSLEDQVESLDRHQKMYIHNLKKAKQDEVTAQNLQDVYKNKYEEVKELELAQRKRANNLQQQLDSMSGYKLDIQG